MENDKRLQDEWNDIQSELRESASELPSRAIENQYQSISQKRLIYNNLIELGLSAMGVPVLGVFLLVMDSTGLLPVWIKWLLWLTSFLALYPSIKLFRDIHFPNHTLNVKQYLEGLIRRLHFYKVYQVFASILSSLIIFGIAILLSRGWTLRVDDQVYTGILNYPFEFKWKYIVGAMLVNMVVSASVGVWAYLMYMLFYKSRRNELKRKLDSLLAD